MTHFEQGEDQTRPELLTPQFNVSFEFFWSRLVEGMELLYSEEQLALLKERALQKEINFYNRVYDEVDKITGSTDNQVYCLFDIDGTLGEVRDDDSPIINTILRPSAEPLIANLAVKYPERLRFGVLSVRPQSNLDGEMDNPTFLYPIRPFLDKDLVFSSEFETRADPFMRSDYSSRLYSRLIDSMRGVINPTILDQTVAGEIDLLDWYDPKLRIMHSFSQVNRDATFVLVDDLPCGEHFDESNPRLKGICVGEFGQLLVPGLTPEAMPEVQI